VRDLQPFVGKELEAKIIELDKNRTQRGAVASRLARADAERGPARTSDPAPEGSQVRKGVVSSIVNFRAFVDLGGVDGLVHVSELSWKHIRPPE